MSDDEYVKQHGYGGMQGYYNRAIQQGGPQQSYHDRGDYLPNEKYPHGSAPNRGDSCFLPASSPFTPTPNGSQTDIIMPQSANSQNSSRPINFEPKHRMPEYDGRITWNAFWLQFQMLAENYNWDEENQPRKLMFSLKGPALYYVAQLPEMTWIRLSILTKVLEHRFGDNILPETYRATLNDTKKQYKGTNREYEVCIRKLVTKAYLGIEGTAMYESLAVEHLVIGLPDPNMSFNILAHKPKTVEEALHQIEWYEYCKAMQKRRSQVRQVKTEDETPLTQTNDADVDIRQFGGKIFITEERLY